MKLTILYEEVKARFPKEVDLILKKLRKSSSKEKNRSVEELTWEFTWAQRIKAFSFAEMITQQREKTFGEIYEVATRENVRIFLDDSIMWRVGARIGRWVASGSPQDSRKAPDEIIDLYVKTFNDQIAERKRIAALTPEEKQAEVEAALKALRDQPGFVEISFGK